jgi:very-short-patch-repair endonuclease
LHRRKPCIEIDGESHLTKEQQEYDAARTEYLEALNRTMIRFTNEDVRYNLHAVVQAILDKCNALKSKKINIGLSPHPALSSLERGDSEQT